MDCPSVSGRKADAIPATANDRATFLSLRAVRQSLLALEIVFNK